MSNTDNLQEARQSIKRRTLEARLPDIRPEVQAAVVAYVRRVTADYADEVLSITLYGSQARGEADFESDIDLFVVIRRDNQALRQALIDLAWQVQFEHNVIISDIIRSVAQLSQMQASQFPFYQNLEQEGILLWQNTSEPTSASA